MSRMNVKLIIFQGLPGSGKSTLAESLVKDSKGSLVRVNRDDIRLEIAGPRYSKPIGKVEKVVTKLQTERIESALRSGKSVVSDDTNLNMKSVQSLQRIAVKFGAEIEVFQVNVPLDVALKRNRARGDSGGRFVPEEVIESMAAKAYADGELKELLLDNVNSRAYMVPKVTEGSVKLANYAHDDPSAGDRVVLVDCDGTLANNAHHAAYAFGRPGEKKDYRFFFNSISDAPVNENVRALVNRYADAGFRVFMLTGRSDEAADQLIDFVKGSGAKISRIIAKREGDYRPDFVFKAEILESLQDEGLKVVAAIDDRPQSIRVWDQRGIHVDRVDYIDPKYDPDNPGPVPTPFVNTPHVDSIVREYLA